ncbi:hypothetical protein [Curtobacterium flaccumfaciens]|uniref:hypothetical protein n=1 Tax=Curtobacterium flaccumfaciens TaxID=2035 RepID=UPI003EBF412D
MSNAPHPRILFEEVPDDLYETLAALAGTHQRISASDMYKIHDSDWDLVVSFAGDPYMGSGMHALSFGAQVLPEYRLHTFTIQPARDVPLLARLVYVPENVAGSDIRRLLETSVVAHDPGTAKRKGLSRLPEKSRVLVAAGEEAQPWAALVPYGRKLLWALPAETSNHVAWLAQILRSLHELDADRFPAEPDWRLRDEWASPSVRAASASLRSIQSERVRILADLDRRQGEAEDELEAALADGALLDLLREQGDALVAAVTLAVRSFGFDVHDMDEHHDEKNGAKLEDLRVAYPPGSQDWTCLVEVKGYGKGAKANDVGQIVSRPPLVFYKETGREADALWHIVNSNREQDPSTRPEALTSGGDLVALTAAGGCFIDTRDLFRAWRDVEEGVATAEEVRTSLMAGRERWEWPAKGSGS